MDISTLFKKIEHRFGRNRLGELLVQRGVLSPEQLKEALLKQKETGHSLGQVLKDLHYTTSFQIRTSLAEQATYRFLSAAVACAIGLFALSGTHAKASSLNNVKPSAYGQNGKHAMIHKAAYHPDLALTMPAPEYKTKPDHYPDLFGSKEIQSEDISAFKKWTDVLGRLDTISFNESQITQFQNMPLAAKVAAVNDFVNRVEYIEDKDNFGKSDYWASPTEFFARGGDCEDFAIAKYSLLKTLGVAEDRMRLAIVQDTVKDIPHAILIVYTDTGAMVMDNQIKTARFIDDIDHYKPIYSINANGWWRHLT
jgi:predicted transglutaminase-like cysteine proteinase